MLMMVPGPVLKLLQLMLAADYPTARRKLQGRAKRRRKDGLGEIATPVRAKRRRKDGLGEIATPVPRTSKKTKKKTRKKMREQGRVPATAVEQPLQGGRSQLQLRSRAAHHF